MPAMPSASHGAAVPPWPDFRDPAFLRGHVRQTLGFYAGRALDPAGGFFHFFKDDGTVYERRVRHLVSSTRFVFNHATAFRAFGDESDRAAARHGLAFVQQAHAHPQGGHAWMIDWDGTRAHLLDDSHQAYGQAFVLLAHAHALMAGIEEARAGLDAAVGLLDRRFWEPAHTLYADEATADWRIGAYRGQNANMHACEAFLAAHEATQDERYLRRSLQLAEAVTQGLAGQSDGLVWEHYDSHWRVDLDYNRHDRTNIFRPWGFQTGHLTEWAKLLLQLRRRLQQAQQDVPDWLLPTATRFFDTAMQRGWDEVHGGLVYGFGPDGAVCDADKYFWVQAESLAAAAWLAVTQQGCAGPGMAAAAERSWTWYRRIWAYAWQHMIDHRHGAWYRIRTPDNRAYGDEKSPAGKTDYHTMGACHDVLRALGEPMAAPRA
ncbi:AGE family epimerase/isomerase [Ideonella sp. BYS139W]|uniref:AGE family epimerase/isomerase n=2 Tax=Pseudaquabacterium rugosum TaxID=2984194 RepID=A0ABU9B8C6_9BURK